MVIKFSEEFKQVIDYVINKYSPKEDIYDHIDYLESDSRYLVYGDFRRLLLEYRNYNSDNKNIIFDMFGSSYQGYYYYNKKQSGQGTDYKWPIHEEAVDSLCDVFKSKNSAEYISTPDKAVIRTYAAILIKYDSAIYDEVKNPSEALQKKLGDDFVKWSDVWSEDNIKLSLHSLTDELIDKRDTHRYNDDVVECFLEASTNEDFIEALSQCQYTMHGVVLDDVSAQDL